ncbi:hypothetical protein PRIEUP_LOCUS5899, partial [Pristimantis euphronides]
RKTPTHQDNPLLSPAHSNQKEKKTVVRVRRRGCRGGRSKRPSEKTENINPNAVDLETNGIFNLSRYILKKEEIEVLSRGLSFCPSSDPDLFELFIDLNAYIRKLTLKRHFALIGNRRKDLKTTEPQDETIYTTGDLDVGTDLYTLFEEPIPSGITIPSNFYPLHSKGSNIDTFYSMVMTEFTNLFQKKKYDNPNRHYNLSSSQWQALRDLASNPDIVIRSADKGGGIVIMDSFYYHQESLNILGDSNYYLKLPNDPTNDYLKELYELLEWGFEIGVISKKERDFLKSKFPTMAFFYFLPKIHKNLENPPGRPIISGIGSLTANISSYLDTFLQRFVIALPSYLRDTGHLLNILKDQEWKENYLWASLDVKSLYSNIDHGLGIEAVKNFLRGDPLMPIRQQDFLLDLLRFVLTHNYFSFEDMIFLQTKGTAMGAKCAPSYANLFMGAFEEFFNINGRSNTVLYKRYIDDLLLIWRGSHDSLKSLVFELNQNNWGLEFTSTIHESNIVFLDL